MGEKPRKTASCGGQTNNPPDWEALGTRLALQGERQGTAERFRRGFWLVHGDPRGGRGSVCGLPAIGLALVVDSVWAGRSMGLSSDLRATPCAA